MPVGRLTKSPCDSEITKAWCNTSSKQIKISYKWTIENFKFIYKNSGNSCTSSTFFDNSNEKYKWYLQLKENDAIGSYEKYICLNLFFLPSKEIEVYGEFKLSILNSKEEEIHKFAGERLLQKDDYAVVKFIEKDLLLNEPDGLLSENKLTILCEISFASDIVNECGQISNLPIKIVKSKLSQDFGKLFEDSKFSDVILVVSDHEFKAHKNVLAARSEVFSAMFEYDFDETKSNRVVITDIDHEVFKEMLYYIYTDNAPNLDKMAHGLFEAADKYALEELKVMCEEALAASLSIETAMDTLVLADRHSANLLENRTKDFIQSHIKDILDNPSWKKSFL